MSASSADENQSNIRITRARAACNNKTAPDGGGGVKNKGGRGRKGKAPKRAAGEMNPSTPVNPKRRAVLGDITNANVPLDCSATPKLQGIGSKRGSLKKIDVRVLSVKNDDALPVSAEAQIASKSDTCVQLDVGLVDPSLPAKETQGEHVDMDSSCKDPQMCSAYVQDIYQHLRDSELKKRPKADFMETLQQDITPNMRGILVNWLVEVAEEYKLVPDTLYLTVGYMDRFLCVYPITRHRLQLLGVTCMLIASKYEEICPPHVEEFCYITDNTYTREEVVSMERKILTFLHFEMTMPTIKTFLRRFIRASQVESKAVAPSSDMEFLSSYLAELTLLECSFLRYLPSLIAASAVFLSLVTLDFKTYPWNATLQHYTGYKPSELKECVTEIFDLQRNRRGSQLMAIREKYRQQKFKRVANLLPPPRLPEKLFQDIGS